MCSTHQGSFLIAGVVSAACKLLRKHCVGVFILLLTYLLYSLIFVKPHLLHDAVWHAGLLPEPNAACSLSSSNSLHYTAQRSLVVPLPARITRDKLYMQARHEKNRRTA
jgi:hypothetical protein